jgi:hypothetical protein
MTTPTDREASEPEHAINANGAVSGDGPVSADEIEADIERTREQLGNTVDALSEKLDVKAQARHTIQNLKPRTVAIAEATLAAALITVGAVLVWRRRRR